MSSPLRKLLPYVLSYRKKLALGFVFLLVTTTIQLVSPWVLKYAIDELMLGVTRSNLIGYAGALLGLAVLGGAGRFFMRRIIIGVSRLIEYDLRNRFFSHLQQLSLSYYQENRTGDLMSRATNDLNAVRMMVGPAIMYSSTTGITFIVAVFLMWAISPRLTFFVLLPLPLVSLAVKSFGSAIYRRSELIQAQLAKMSAITQETLTGVRVVRAYNREALEIERFKDANYEYVERSRSVIRLQGIFYPSLALLLGLSGLAVLAIGTREVVSARMSLGDFVAFNAYLMMLTWPMIAFGWVTNILQRGLAAWKRMLDVLETEPTIKAPVAPSIVSNVGETKGAITFKELSFSYRDRPVLRNVSAVIKPGQSLGVVGPTGSGKSTLVNLLPRLFDPPEGTVFIDDHDVRDIPLAVLRGFIGYVPQEPILFSDSIIKNVMFGSHSNKKSLDAAEQAIEISRLDKDLQGFPKGFETEIGERGITLSGGQKQRVAIARALMVDPKILVLDDALSAVDTQTEDEIFSHLHHIMRERTSVVVSHRISAVRDADLILVLEDGRVHERGTHNELVDAGGVYANLYQKQQLQAELEES